MTELERRLEAAAPHYPFPATPDVAAAARARLQTRGSRRRLVTAALVGAALAAATLALSSGARATLADWLDGLPGVEIERVPELPSVPLAGTVEYGEPASLADYDVRVPDVLGDPDHVYAYRDESGGTVVTLVYGGPDQARAVLSQWPARLVLTEKLVGPSTRVDRVEVDGAPGAWIHGGDHAVFYVGLDGGERRAAAALAGNVLVWWRGRQVYRLEVDAPLDRALEIAASLE